MSNQYLGSLSQKWSKGSRVKFANNKTLAFVEDLADKAQPFGFRVHVTSAYRSPADQSRVVCNNVQNTNGANLSVYGETTRKVYRKHCPGNMSAIVEYETKKLANAIRKNPNHEGHGTGFSVDLSVSGMDYNTKVRYKQLIESMGSKVLWEKNPEHFHIWLKNYNPTDYGWTKVLAYGGLLASLGLSGLLAYAVGKRKGWWQRLSRLSGSKFDMRTMDQIESQRQEKEFVPFYIILSQSYQSFGMVGERVNSREIEKDKKIVFGPFKQKDANQAMQSLAVFFRSFGSGRTFKPKNYDGEINQYMIDQYFEFFDNTKMWSGPNDYNPYLNIAPSRTSHVQRGPDKGKTYTTEWISILENSHIDGRDGFGDKDTMAHMSFEMWTWSPNYKKEGNEFYQTYGRPEEKQAPIPIYSPVMFQMWQTYLLSELAQLYTFPTFNK